MNLLQMVLVRHFLLIFGGLDKGFGFDFGSDTEDIPDKDLSHTSAKLWGLQCGKATLDPRRPPPDNDQVSREKMEA